MAWFRLDDQAAFHQKVMDAGNEAFGAWVRMGCWSSARGLDGKVTASAAVTIASTKKILDRLISVGLLERDGPDLLIHDYLDWNPSADAVARKRKERSAAGQRGGRISASNRPSKTEANGQADSKQTGKQLLEQNKSKTEPNDQSNFNPVPVPVPGRERDAHAGDGDLVPSRVPGWFQEAWKRRAGVLMLPEANLVEPWNLVADYAEETSMEAPIAADRLFDAFDRVQEHWTGKTRWATHLFVRHFEAIQRQAGAKAKASAGTNALAEAVLRARGDA